MPQIIGKAKCEFMGVDIAEDKFDVCLADENKISCVLLF